jgi:hypothetical protein
MEDFHSEVAHLKKALKRNFKGCFLAGWAITSLFTNRKIRDYDLYFKNKERFLDALRWTYDAGSWCVAITPRAITFIDNNEIVYQLMSFAWFETAEQIFDRFDFTCCMAAIDLESDALLRHKDFIRDLAKRSLRFNHTTDFPIGSALRVKKYQSRGYTIEDSEFLKVMLACSFKEIKTWDDLKNQIGGQYGEAVVMDTSREFTLENAIISLNETLIEKPQYQNVEGADSFENAIKIIFGNEEALKSDDSIPDKEGAKVTATIA